MQRGPAAVFGVLFIAVVAVVVWRARTPAQRPAAAASASASASAARPPTSTTAAGAADAGLDLVSERASDSESKGYDRLPDGGAIPDLQATAPKTVGFGVILFSYKGAQFAPSDAPSKVEAQAKARAVVAAARENFGEAVKKGDRGSTADAGRIPRGVLEPYLEYVLFTLEKASVHAEPLDTPRGYWIIRRNE